MRTHVSFRFPAEFVSADGDEAILGVRGAGWFIERLLRIPGLKVAEEPAQDDWGVFIRVKRGRSAFWIGLSSFGDHEWLVHLHRFPFGWLWRVFYPTKNELGSLVDDLHAVLASDAAVSRIEWHHERDLRHWTPKARNA